MLEFASWAALMAILLFISEMHLMRGIERWGAVSVVFVGASALCFPLVWIRRTAIEQSVTRLLRAVILSALCALLLPFRLNAIFVRNHTRSIPLRRAAESYHA